MEKYDLVIIGGGPVGLFAAFYAGRRNMKTLMVEASEALGGLPYLIYSEKVILDIPGFSQVTGYELSKRLVEQSQSEMLTVMTETKVLSHEGNLESGFTLHCACKDGPKDIQASTVLIATGAGEISPRTIGVPGEESLKDKGVHYFIKSKEAIKGKKVVVIGGGDSALDWVDLVEDVAEEVRLVHRREEFRAQEESVRRLMASKTKLHLNAEVKAIHGEASVTAVEIFTEGTGSEIVGCDVVIIAFGFRIQLETLNSWGLELESGGIVVNQMMETNIPGIFAAGDVAYTPGVGSTKLIAIGFAQGTIAVNTAKTRIDPKAKFFPGHSTAWK